MVKKGKKQTFTFLWIGDKFCSKIELMKLLFEIRRRVSDYQDRKNLC